MYESYAWPGAGSKKDTGLFVKLIKEFFEGLIEEIERREKKD